MPWRLSQMASHCRCSRYTFDDHHQLIKINTMAELNPYLSFNDNCEEAFNHYRSVFGGEFGQTMRFGDAAEAGMPASEANKIMHMELPIGKKSILMGSDTPVSMGTQ